jgi:hypothetical protein
MPISRATILSFDRAVKCVDQSTSGLELYCYNKCGDKDEQYHKCRGVVFHQNGDLILSGFPYTFEFNHEEVDLMVDKIPVSKSTRFFDSHEGTLIRVFHFDGEWFTSTHKKLDAFRSKWASKSTFFGNSFANAWRKCLGDEMVAPITGRVENLKEVKKDLELKDKAYLNSVYEKYLDKTKKYMFLLKPTMEERVVVEVPREDEFHIPLYHVGTFVRPENATEDELDLDDFIQLEHENERIPKPREHHFSSIEAAADHVDNMDYRYLQGLIIFTKQDEVKVFKMFNAGYQHFLRVRNNVPSIRFRYLQIRNDVDKIRDLVHLYPEWEERFDQIEEEIYEVCKNLFELYKNRFITKVDQNKHDDIIEDALKMIHNEYRRTFEKMTPGRINDLLCFGGDYRDEKRKNGPGTPTFLNHLHKRYLEVGRTTI